MWSNQFICYFVLFHFVFFYFDYFFYFIRGGKRCEGVCKILILDYGVSHIRKGILWRIFSFYWNLIHIHPYCPYFLIFHLLFFSFLILSSYQLELLLRGCNDNIIIKKTRTNMGYEIFIEEDRIYDATIHLARIWSRMGGIEISLWFRISINHDMSQGSIWNCHWINRLQSYELVAPPENEFVADSECPSLWPSKFQERVTLRLVEDFHKENYISKAEIKELEQQHFGEIGNSTTTLAPLDDNAIEKLNFNFF